jgi:hypothetical protein
VAGYARKRKEITAAGTVQDLHLVPYYPDQEIPTGTIIQTNIGKTFALCSIQFINRD